MLYQNDKNIEKDFAKSLFYFKKSYQQGSVYALNRIDLCYYHGYGTKKTIQKRLNILKK